MRVALLAPTDRSLYSRLVAWRLAQQDGIELCAVVARSLWSWKRLRGELRRDGPRLLDKILGKLIMGEQIGSDINQESLTRMAETSGLAYRRLSELAAGLDVPYRKVPDHNHPASESILRQSQPDLIAFTGGGLIRANILDLPRMGVLNCHAGLLPHYRGMDVVEWAILEAAGAPSQTGITLHFMDRGVDTGPIVKALPIEPQPEEGLVALRARLLPNMVELMVDGILGLRDGRYEPRPQAAEAGKQYFVMHPRLQKAAADQLRSMML